MTAAALPPARDGAPRWTAAAMMAPASLVVTIGIVIPKNAPNKDGAHVWLNEMLATTAQEAFAEDMGYNASVTNAKIPVSSSGASEMESR